MVAQITPLRLLILFAFVASLAALVAMSSEPHGSEAISFNPTGSGCLDDPDTVDPDPLVLGSPNECDGNNTPGAAAAITTTFGITAPDSNFGAVVGFTPPDWGVKAGGDVPDGTLAAQLTSLAVLGLINNACSNMVRVDFDMLDATLDMGTQVDFDDQWELVGGLPRGVVEYPDYLTRVLVSNTDDPTSTVTPYARYYGQTNVSGVDVSLSFVLYEPGVTLRGTTFAKQLGYPSVTVLQAGPDPEIDPAPNAITDFCSPLQVSTTTFESVRTNPAADGSYVFINFAQSQRDADNDGHENGLDPCPFDPNPDWDPRSNSYTGDTDRDRMPDNCDSDPNNNVGPAPDGRTHDEDGDAYQNSQDNCPKVGNSEGIDHAYAKGPDNQADGDNDGIGDACDPNPDTADGEVTTVCKTSVIDIGAGGTPRPRPHSRRGPHVLLTLRHRHRHRHFRWPDSYSGPRRRRRWRRRWRRRRYRRPDLRYWQPFADEHRRAHVGSRADGSGYRRHPRLRRVRRRPQPAPPVSCSPNRNERWGLPAWSPLRFWRSSP
jgi:hypothetical protein